MHRTRRILLGQRLTHQSPLAGSRVGALHEAAHALVGQLLGWRIDWVKLYEPGEAGRTGFDGGALMVPPPRPALAHRSAVRLAGEMAEILCTARDSRQIGDDSEDDWEQLLAVDLGRSHLSRQQKSRIIRQGRGLARTLINRNMNALMRLAAAVHKGSVSARQARKIIEG
jgi:hypothetical protein